MSNVFLSFVGLGFLNHKTSQYGYDITTYKLNGKESNKTEFIQVAEIQILGAQSFDRIIIVATQKSYDTHFEELESQLIQTGAKNISHLIISEEMAPESQWKWFEQVLDLIERDDKLTIDLTHGYRSIPIIFSTAINFLQKAKNITLKAVYYGAYEKNKKLVPIIDMKDFYIINEWAEAVSRLVEDADARKLAEISRKAPEFQVKELADESLIKSFEALTNTVRNVDINNVADKANTTIKLVEERIRDASVTGKILLKMVINKFASLSTKGPVSGKYDKAYFHIQLEIISLLLDHKLFMQAYTVMRELIGSIGMVEIENACFFNKKGRNHRYRFADVFINMFQHERKKWRFENKDKELSVLIPYYNKLVTTEIEKILRIFSKDLTNYRNGFDHAWTSKSKAYSDIEEKGYQFFRNLKEVVRLLEENNILI